VYSTAVYFLAMTRSKIAYKSIQIIDTMNKINESIDKRLFLFGIRRFSTHY